MDTRESDWKVLRELKPVALDRFTERILSELSAISADTTKTNHERYLAVYRRLHERDEELAAAFNDLKRSNSLPKLAMMQCHELLTEEEMARFSPELQESVRGLVPILRS